MQIQILKTLIGSHAHGLATPQSDYDYRGVFVVPTSELLSLGYDYKATNWIEGKEDNTSYELAHFLMLALKCNPSILEVFKAPIVPLDYDFKDAENDHKIGIWHQYGRELRDLFPYVWNPKGVFDAFVGYGLNQRKKMLDNHLDRWNKYGVAYVRTLMNLNSLLDKGDFSLEIHPVDRPLLLSIKHKEMSVGEIIDLCDTWTESAKAKLQYYIDGRKVQVPQPEKVNDFLLKVRKENW